MSWVTGQGLLDFCAGVQDGAVVAAAEVGRDLLQRHRMTAVRAERLSGVATKWPNVYILT